MKARLAFLALCLAARAWAIVGGDDLEGKAARPYLPVVRLSLSPRGICTGTHLGGGRILTARHCFDGETRFPAIKVTTVEKSEVAALGGSDYDAETPPVVYVEEVVTARGKTITISQPDVGILTPKDPAVRARLAELPTARPDFSPLAPNAKDALIAGHGNDHFGPEDTSGFAVGKARIVRVGSFLVGSRYKKGEGFAAISHGDSGGPLLTWRNGVIGVHGIATTLDATRPEVEFSHVNIAGSWVRRWLEQRLGL